jgi:CRP/FNR family cyclic AMP-dependent transcriptional regulator
VSSFDQTANDPVGIIEPYSKVFSPARSVPVPCTKCGPVLSRDAGLVVISMTTFNPQNLKQIRNGKTTLAPPKKQVLFSQGDTTDAVFYVQAGKVKLTVVSPQGKEAVLAILGPGCFFGEGGLAGQPVYVATATTVEDASIVRIDKQSMRRLLLDDRMFAALFLSHMLARNVRIQEDLVDQLFNSSEKRLARILLLKARFGKNGTPLEVIPRISQETLAGMIGTTRSRVSFFMNRFKKKGLIHYESGLHVHSSLLNIVLHN